MNGRQTRVHHSGHIQKELPQIPPYPYKHPSEDDKYQLLRNKSKNPRVRFSLPANTLLAIEDYNEESPSANSQSKVLSSNVAFDTSPTKDIFLLQKSASEQPIAAYRKSKRRNSMFLFETTSHKLNNDTHETFVTPQDSSHFKISIPLVIRTPPKLSKVKRKGDELLDKELFFNGVEYEMIEVIDDDTSGNSEDDLIIVGERKKVTNEGSPLRQPPMSRIDFEEKEVPESPDSSRGRAKNTQVEMRDTSIPSYNLKGKAVEHNTKKSSPLKSAMKQKPVPLEPTQLSFSNTFEIDGNAQNKLQTPISQYLGENGLQQKDLDDEYPDRVPSVEQLYNEIFPPGEVNYQGQDYMTQQQSIRDMYSFPNLSNSYGQANVSNPDGSYDQVRETYRYPLDQNPYKEFSNLNPYLPKDHHIHHEPVNSQDNHEQAEKTHTNSDFASSLTFPSPEATAQLHERTNEIDNNYYQEANSHDYTQTVLETKVHNREKILSQSPRRHNHTRSKSQINILADFNDLTIDTPKEERSITGQRRHKHTRSKSQINILTQFDNVGVQTETTAKNSKEIYSQTTSVKEIVIPELSNSPLLPLELAKVNSKLDFYLKDQMESTSMREKASKVNMEATRAHFTRNERPSSPINSHSSYESALSLGRSNSTYATSVNESANIMIDLTNENQEILITRDKLKGSFSSYRSIKQNDKNGRPIEVVLVEDDNELDLIDQYANDFEVHDSINRKNSIASANADLGKVYSMYRKFTYNTPSSIQKAKNSSLASFRQPMNPAIRSQFERISSVDSTFSTNSFQAGDEQNLFVVSLQHSPLDLRNKHVVTTSTRRQVKISTDRQERMVSDLHSEPSSFKSTTKVLNPIDNLFINRHRRDRSSENKISNHKENSKTKEDYLDYNNSSYDFNSYIRTN